MLAGGVLRELQRVADEVGELDDFVALVVMAEDDERVAERRLGGRDAHVHFVVRQAAGTRSGSGWRSREARLLVIGEELDIALLRCDRL